MVPEPLFQYRNWSIEDNPIERDGDSTLGADNSAEGSDISLATSDLHGSGATSIFDEKTQLAVQDDDEKARAGLSEQRYLAIVKSIVTEIVPNSSRHAILRYLQDVETWNPDIDSQKYERDAASICHSDISAEAATDFPIDTELKLDAPSIYLSARSETVTSEVFQSAASYTGECRITLPEATLIQSEYLKMLETRDLWPVDPSVEQNWSGEGQHVEYKKGDIVKINNLLTIDKPLGRGRAGSVYKVKCGRIFMARKTIHIGRCCTKDQAISEVAHMTRLEHAHIVRVIGTYIWTSDFCILMYPVANGDLGTFLEHMGKTSLKTTSLRPGSHNVPASEEVPFDLTQVTAMAQSCQGSFSCLSSAIRCIHQNITKHMDIKPANILVRSRWCDRGGKRAVYESRVYISDFGISRSYENIDAANTDGDTSFTRKYASPEVYRRFDRDLSADIFSLGCVFLEMFAALEHFSSTQPLAIPSERLPGLGNEHVLETSSEIQDELRNLLESNHTDGSYQGVLDPLQELIKAQLPQYKRVWGASVLKARTLRLISKMMQFEPQDRPTADDLIAEFGERLCCVAGPDKLEGADDDIELQPEADPDYLADHCSSNSSETGSREEPNRAAGPDGELFTMLFSGMAGWARDHGELTPNAMITACTTTAKVKETKWKRLAKNDERIVTPST